MALNETVGIGVGIKATDKTGLDLIQQTAASLDEARQAAAAAQKQGGIVGIVGQNEAKRVDQLTNSAAKLASKLLDTQEALVGLKKTDPGYKQMAADVENLTRQLQELNTAAARTPNVIPTGTPGAIGAQADTFRQSTGDVSTTLGGAGSVVGGIIGGGAGGALQLGGDVAGLLEYIPAFKKSLVDLASIAVDTPGIIGKVAGGLITTLTPALGATGASIATVGVLALPVIAILGGLVAIFKSIEASGAAGTAAAEKYIAALERQIQIDRQIADFLESGDLEGAKQRQAELLKEQEDVNAQLTYLYDERARIDQEYADLGSQLNANRRSELGAEGARLDDEIKKLYNDQFLPVTEALTELGESLDEITAAASEQEAIREQVDLLRQRAALEQGLAEAIRLGNVQGLEQRRAAIEAELASLKAMIPEFETLSAESEYAAQALDDATARQAELNTELGYYTDTAIQAAAASKTLIDQQRAALADITARVQTETQVAGLLRQASAESARARIQAIEDERAAINNILPELDKLAETSDEAARQAENYRTRLNQLGAEMGALGDAMPELRAAEITKGLYEIAQAELDTNRKIGDIRRAGLAEIAQIEATASAAQVDAVKKRESAITKSILDSSKQIDSINKAYMESERKAFAKLREQEAKEQGRYQKERLRLLDDLNESLLDAEENNDVVAFKQAKRAGEKRLNELNKDATDAEKERAAAFLAERKAAEEQNAQRLADIKTQADEQRRLIEDNYKADLEAAETTRRENLARQKEAERERIAAEEQALAERILAIQNQYDLEDSIIQAFFDKRKARYSEDDKIITERLDTALARHAEDTRLKSEYETTSATRTARQKADAEQAAATQTAAVMRSSFIAAGGAVQIAINQIIAQLNAAKASMQSGVLGAGGSSPGNSGRGGRGYRPIAFANEGIITATDRPVLGLLGEDLLPGQIEAVVKFQPSKGIPPNIRGGGGLNLTISNMVIGNGMSRAEIYAAVYDGVGGVLDGLADSSRGVK